MTPISQARRIRALVRERTGYSPWIDFPSLQHGGLSPEDFNAVEAFLLMLPSPRQDWMYGDGQARANYRALADFLLAIRPPAFKPH